MSSEVFMNAVPSTECPAAYRVTLRASLAWCGLLGTGYFFFWRQRQPEHRNHSLPRNIHFGFLGIREIERLAMFAAVALGIRSPGFLRVAASLLDDILRVEPAFQMSAAELALLIFLVAGTLPGLL